MDCNGESDRKDDEPWQHDCEGNCVSVHVYLALHSGAASLALHVGTDCAPCASFTRGTYGSPPILLISRQLSPCLQKVYYCNHCYTLLSERTVSTAREVLSGQRRGMGAYLAFAGPVVVASIAYIDPGNFATNIQAGAKYGYGLLWVVLLANMIAMLFQALSAKLGIVTGRNLAEMCRDGFPRPVVWAMWVISEIAAMATDLAEFLGGAIGLSLLFGLPLLAGMVLTGFIVYGILNSNGSASGRSS